MQLVVTEEDNPVHLSRWSINTTGFGFDAAVSNMKTKVPWLKGLSLYLTSSLLTLSSYSATRLQSTREGSAPFDGLMIAAGIGQFEGGGFRLFPEASIMGKTFHVCEVREHNKIRALPLLLKAVGGRHVGSERIAMSEATEIRLQSDKPIPVHADGEVVSLRAKEVVIRLIPGALRVLVPSA